MMIPVEMMMIPSLSGQTTVVIEDVESRRPQWVTVEGEFANLQVIIQILPEE